MKDGLKHLQVKKQWMEAMNFRRDNTAFIEESYKWERGTIKNSSKLIEPLFHKRLLRSWLVVAQKIDHLLKG